MVADILSMTDDFFVILDHFLPFYSLMDPEISSVMDRVFCHLGQFFAHLPPKNPKNKILKKLKNGLEILSFYTSVPKIVIICFNVPEIWHMDVIVIFHFGLFFCPFTPVIAQKNQNFNKKKYLEISSFYTCVPKIMIR